ncbi:hypothetical protein MTR67_031524 [Solanum verrucosum]|uniref:Uncharacterized protein n=1 Tax=Solanum verrucosum TaxID=315347 RepID=A0AAF0U2T0_SOLVR|nr:hypothetical protein MTR67_031524 [Solanum verrucosum]
MEHKAPHVPLCIDTTDEIPLANIVPTRGRNHPRSLHKKSLSNPRPIPLSPHLNLTGITHFRKQSVLRERVVTGFGGLEMAILLTKLEVWYAQTVKDVVGRVDHTALPVSMRSPDNPLQRLTNQLATKEDQLLAMENAHQMEKATLEAHIVELQNELAEERAANITIVQHLTQLLHDPKPTSAS